jgi:hypothetical protein
VQGTVDWAGGAFSARHSLFYSGQSGTSRIDIHPGAVVNPPPSAVASFDRHSEASSTALDRLNNAGLIGVDRASLTVARGWQLENTGTIRVTAGSLTINTQSVTNSAVLTLTIGRRRRPNRA